MNGFVQDIEDLAVANDAFRSVLYTAQHCQLVVMCGSSTGGPSRHATFPFVRL